MASEKSVAFDFAAGAEERRLKVEATQDPEPDINVTPLVDISLVLVIIFLVTSPFMTERDISVQSNKVDKTALQIQRAKKLTLSMFVDPKTKVAMGTLKEEILENGKRKIDVKNYTIGDDLAAAIESKIASFPADEKTLYLDPKDDVMHGDVVHALDLAKQHGVEKLSFMTVEKEVPKEQQE